jgi:hypothetical protein
LIFACSKQKENKEQIFTLAGDGDEQWTVNSGDERWNDRWWRRTLTMVGWLVVEMIGDEQWTMCGNFVKRKCKGDGKVVLCGGSQFGPPPSIVKETH